MKASEEELLHRLNRYESLLSAHRIPLDELNPTSIRNRGTSLLEPSKAQVLSEEVDAPQKENGNNHRSLQHPGHFIIDDEKKIFVESVLWNSLSEELQDPVDILRLYQTSGKDSDRYPTGAP